MYMLIWPAISKHPVWPLLKMIHINIFWPWRLQLVWKAFTTLILPDFFLSIFYDNCSWSQTDDISARSDSQKWKTKAINNINITVDFMRRLQSSVWIFVIGGCAAITRTNKKCHHVLARAEKERRERESLRRRPGLHLPLLQQMDWQKKVPVFQPPLPSAILFFVVSSVARIRW